MKLRDTFRALAIALVFCVTVVHAQDQKQDSQSSSPVFPIPPMDSAGGYESGKAPAAAARGVSRA